MENPKTPEALAEIPIDKSLQEGFIDSEASVNSVGVGEGTNAGVDVDKIVGEDYCADADEIKIDLLMYNDAGREIQMQACVTESQFDGTSLPVNFENVEKEYKVANVPAEGIKIEKVVHSNETNSAPNVGDTQNFDEGKCKEILDMSDTKKVEYIEELQTIVDQEKEQMVIDNSESGFSRGDLVWVETKSESWWPGQICDSSDAPKYATKNHTADGLFVRYFGNGNYVWCCPSQLKHLHDNFEHMSSQSKSKSFVVALEKALGEFSKQLKSDMICSCKSHASEDKVSNGLSRSHHKTCEYSLNHFEPGWFLLDLKKLALIDYIPGKLDLVVVQSRLWAFYCYSGHRHLSVREIRDPDGQRLDDDKDSLRTPIKEKGDMDAVPGEYKNSSAEERALLSKHTLGSSIIVKYDTEVGNGCEEAEVKVISDKGFESRERKRSKYLSPPYTDVNWDRKGIPEPEIEDSKISKVSWEGGTTVVNNSGKKSLKKSMKNPIDASKYVEVLKSKSSANFLSELHTAALNCLYPKENECFDSTEMVFSMFRRYVYHDEPTFELSRLKNIDGSNEVLDSTGAAVGNDDITGSSRLSSPKVGVEKKKRNRKGKNTEGSLGVSSPDVGINGNNVMLNFALENPQVTGNVTSDGKKLEPKKRSRKGNNTAGSSVISFPDAGINGNDVMLNFTLENPLVTSNVTSEDKKPEPKKRKRKEKTGKEGSNNNSTVCAGVGNLNENHVKPISLVVDLHISPQPYLGTGLPDVNGSSVPQELGFISFEGKSECKKRKKKEKPVTDSQNGSFGIPDLNGKDSTQVIKPERKRRKKGDGPSSKNSKIVTNNEALRTTLLLTFDSENPMPSKGNLVSTFSKFESFRESETLLFEDSKSAHVVFSTNCDAVEAVKFLETENPFSPSLVNYKFQHISAPAVSPVKGVKILAISKPPSGDRVGDAPPLDVIRQNLEIMTSMLEKSGDKLSADMKSKLEADIKSLMKKVSTMTGCPSSL